jgi:hypothetical protein
MAAPTQCRIDNNLVSNMDLIDSSAGGHHNACPIRPGNERHGGTVLFPASNEQVSAIQGCGLQLDQDLIPSWLWQRHIL